jgi:hypothetical protein
MLKRSELLIIGLLLFIAIVNVMDIQYDYGRGASDLHMLGEVIIVLMSLGAIKRTCCWSRTGEQSQ